MLVAFDANVLIDLFNPRIKGDRRARLDGLLEQHAKSKIIIPTLSLTELLVRADKARDELMAKLSAHRSFRIEAFDQRAATECALLLADHWSTDARKGITRTKFKFDWQIVAIALSRNVRQIYSDDADLKRIAEPLPLTVTAIDDLPIPASARQTKLEFKS